MINNKKLLAYSVYIFLVCNVMTACNKKSNQALSEKEVIAIALKELQRPETVESIKYNPNALLLLKVEPGASGSSLVLFSDTLNNITLFVTVMGEGHTEISFDPSGWKPTDTLK